MDIIDIVLSKKYTDESLKGITGTLAGKNCTIKSATKADGCYYSSALFWQ